MSSLAPNPNERRWCSTHERLEGPPFECFRTLSEQSSIADKYNAYTRAYNEGKIQHEEDWESFANRWSGEIAVSRDFSHLKVKRYSPMDENDWRAVQRAIGRLSAGLSTISFKDGELQLTDETLREYRYSFNDEMALQGWIQYNLGQKERKNA